MENLLFLDVPILKHIRVVSAYLFHLINLVNTELQILIRGATEDNSKIIFLISQLKHYDVTLIRTISVRRF